MRGIYVIDPERKLQLHLTYPVAVGRNFFEVLRVLDSLQITSYHQVRSTRTTPPMFSPSLATGVSSDMLKMWNRCVCASSAGFHYVVLTCPFYVL